MRFRPAEKRLLKLRRDGFALVASLMLLVLMTTLAFGLLALSSIELRKGSHETARVRAQANARLALALAIGKLQRAAGPDQRVTARADVEASTGQRRWAGVWRRTRKNGQAELPVVRWDERESVLIDARNDKAVRPQDFFEDWLVSGSEVTPASPGAELATLVGEGSVATPADEVEAPLVRIDDGQGNAGAYAFWVSDESMKASMNAPLRREGDDSPTFQPERYGIGALEEVESVDDADDEALAKVIDYRESVLAGKAAP